MIQRICTYKTFQKLLRLNANFRVNRPHTRRPDDFDAGQQPAAPCSTWVRVEAPIAPIHLENLFCWRRVPNSFHSGRPTTPFVPTYLTNLTTRRLPNSFKGLAGIICVNCVVLPDDHISTSIKTDRHSHQQRRPSLR